MDRFRCLSALAVAIAAIVNLTNSTTAAAAVRAAAVCPDFTVTASNNGPVCPGERTILSASSNETGVDYLWSGRFTFQVPGQHALAFFAGAYTVHATNSAGCRASAQTIVTHKVPARVNVSVPSTRLCGRGPLAATVTNPAAFTAFEWTVSGGSIVSGQGTPSIEAEPNFFGNMHMIVHATDPISGCRSINSAIIDTAPVPDATISAPGSICTDAPNTASAPLDRLVAYAWTIANGTIVSGHGTNSVRFLRADAGDVTLTAVVRNNQCTVSETIVIPASGPKALLDVHALTCAGGEAVIPVALIGSPPFSITWSDGVTQEGIPTTTVARSVSPLESTAYAITAVSDANCAGTAEGSAQVTVESLPQIARQPQSTTIARGQRATLAVAAIGTNLRFYWYEGVSGDRARLVAASRTYTTPPLHAAASYWVDVVGGCGSAQSQTARVTVSARRRAARH